MDKLVKFIKANDLNFEGEGSDLNSNCVVIAGYADYCGLNSADIKRAIKTTCKIPKLRESLIKEINNTFDFAYTYNYGNWWKKPHASKMYKF